MKIVIIGVTKPSYIFLDKMRFVLAFYFGLCILLESSHSFRLSSPDSKTNDEKKSSPLIASFKTNKTKNNRRKILKIDNFLSNPIFTASVIDMNSMPTLQEPSTSVPTPTITSTPSKNNKISLPIVKPTEKIIASPTMINVPNKAEPKIVFPPTHPTTSFTNNNEYQSYPNDWFNYDPTSHLYGPKYWDKIHLKKDNIYLQYLGDDHYNTSNVTCNDNNDDYEQQSPIDLIESEKCHDDHAAGLNRGKNKFQELQFLVLPSVLQVITGEMKSAAKTDFSNLSNMIPVVFVNVKIPSEHSIFGKKYNGEIQIYHYLDREKEKFVVTSILMDDASDKENIHLEQFIREWEEVAWKKKTECDRASNPTNPPYNRTYARLTPEEMAQIWGTTDEPDKSDFDLHRLTTTGWYCGYEGSITEPPCSSRVHWRVLDVPMKISKMQLQRMKNVLLGRLNDNCQQETAAYSGSVSRPLQMKTKNVWCCTSKDWLFIHHRDPSFWLPQWDLDYHGWKSIEVLKNKTASLP